MVWWWSSQLDKIVNDRPALSTSLWRDDLTWLLLSSSLSSSPWLLLLLPFGLVDLCVFLRVDKEPVAPCSIVSVMYVASLILLQQSFCLFKKEHATTECTFLKNLKLLLSLIMKYIACIKLCQQISSSYHHPCFINIHVHTFVGVFL